jgi:transcriptional regulator with XRE-family HTH domain
LITGYVVKLIRESVGLTQFQLAESLGVDVASVQGWETGRRPITSMRVRDLAQLRVELMRLGAHPKTLAVLGDAIEADLVIDYAIQRGDAASDSRGHPLAAFVHKRDLTSLITWPFTGSTPSQLEAFVEPSARRRGPTSNYPELGLDERERLFGHLLAVADERRGDDQTLLRRQAIYLLAFDRRPTTAAWLIDEHRQALRRARSTNDVPAWVNVRSASVALARYGNQEPLLDFIATGLRDEVHAIANLNYWTYWVGGHDTRADDSFMTDADPRRTPADRLFHHLVHRLDSSSEQLELYLHTLWQLMTVQPTVVVRNPHSRALAMEKVAKLNDTSLTATAKRQLSDIAFGLRLG